MLSLALEMEEKGKVFYEKAVQSCKNELGRQIFATLIKDELMHMETIRSIYNELTSNEQWSESWKAKVPEHGDLGTFFRELAAKHKTDITADTNDLQALAVGIDFEAKSIKFYSEDLPKASSPLEKAFLERMIVEEKSHHALLVDTKQYLEDPASYFLEKERAGYDGQ